MQSQRYSVTWPFQALADETRFRVVRLLASVSEPCTAGQLACAVQRPPSHLSRHLEVLQVAGLIKLERRGSWRYVGLQTSEAGVESLCAAVLALGDAEGLFARDIERLLQAGNGSGGALDHAASGASGGEAPGSASGDATD